LLGIAGRAGRERWLGGPPNPREEIVMARRRLLGGKGGMTVAEAGRKGGETVRDTRGHEFYEEIGRKGGRRVRDLIAAGRRALERR
jgi:general stress protein YciG